MNTVLFIIKNVYDIKSFDDIKTLPFIVQKEGSFTRKLFDEFTSNNSFTPISSIEVTSHELGYEFIKDGLGIGLTYDDIIKDDFIKKVSLPEKIENSLILATNKNIIMSNAAKEFSKLLK